MMGRFIYAADGAVGRPDLSTGAPLHLLHLRENITQIGSICKRFSVGTRFYLCGPMNKIRNVSESAISGEGKHESLPVIEEQVEIGKRIVEGGGFRLIKKVDEETVEIPLKWHATEYTLERVPVNRYVEAPPPIRQEGDTMIFSVVEEELVVHKRLKVVEELRITSSVKETVKHTEVTLRKERVIVEKI